MTLYLIKNESDSRAALQRLLFRHTGHADFRVQTVPGGKPYAVSDTYPSPLFFSLSHSGGLFALLIHEHPVGVDLQAHSNVRTERLARRWFHPAEYAAYLAGGCRDEDFFTLWTAKEAYAKYTGLGIASTARRLSVLSVPESVYALACLNGYSLCCCAVGDTGITIHADLAVESYHPASPVPIRSAIYK